MLTCEEVDEVLGHTKSLLQVLEDTISRCKTLVAVIEESQWQSTELISEHFILNSVTGRLSDACGAGQRLCKELLQFKFKLGTLSDAGSFYERIQASIEQKKDELDARYTEIQIERSAFEEEQEKSANSKGKCKKCSKKDEENEEAKKIKESPSQTTANEEVGKDENDCFEEILMWQLQLQFKKTEEALNAKAAAEKDLRDVTDKVQLQREAIGALETELCASRESYDGAVNLRDAESQTIGVTTCTSCSPVQKERRSSVEMLFYGQSDDGNMENDRLLSSRQSSQPNCLTVPRILTTPVSRARANLLLRQGHLTRLIKGLLEENARLKEDLQKLKVDNSILSKKAKEAVTDSYHIKNQLSVNATDKEELQKKMQKFKEQGQSNQPQFFEQRSFPLDPGPETEAIDISEMNHKLQNSLKKQASGFVQSRKQREQFEEEIRWSQIPAVARIGSEKGSHRTSQEEKSTRTRNTQTPRW